MTKMTIGGAISATIAFVSENWKMMLAIMAGAVVICAVLGALLLRSAMAKMMTLQGDPTAAFGAFGSFMLFGILAGTIIYAASMLIWRSGLVGNNPAEDIGWSLGAGIAFMLAMLVVSIALIIVVYIVMLIFGLLAFAVFGASGMSLESLASGSASAGFIAFGALIYIAIVAFYLWFFGRLSIAGPVMAANRSSNPFAALIESWKLTSTSQWTIVGYYVLITIAAVIYMFVAMMIVGGISGTMMSGSVGMGAMIGGGLVGLVFYLPIILVSVAIPPAIYRSVGGGGSGEVFA